MKNLKLIMFALIVLATSCGKEELVKPEQTVRYTVECDYCLIYVEDNTWNRTNELERGKKQHFVVEGKWNYEFVNKGDLDSVKMEISVSIFTNVQKVKASISTNDKRRVEYNDLLGFDGISDSFKLEHFIELKLN